MKRRKRKNTLTTQSQQAKRLVYLLKKFQNGAKLSAMEVHNVICEEFGKVTLRTVQRDLRVLIESEPAMAIDKDGRTALYYIPRTLRPAAPVRLESHDLLSFHVLKAHLKTFKKTVIEEHANRLYSQLEELAPYSVVDSESLYWSKNIGQFNYEDYDKIIRRIIHYTTKRQWVSLKYTTLENLHKPKRYKAFLRSIFTYFGYLYVIAWLEGHDDYVALALHRIEELEPIEKQNIKVPRFKFDEFSRKRFGVFNGQLKKVLLKISKEYAHYFENRNWHETQKISYDVEGNMLLSMTVPIAQDFVSWLLSWGEAITIVKPPALKEKIMDEAKKIISNNKK